MARSFAFIRLSRTAGTLFVSSALLIGTAIGPVAPVQAAGDVGYQDGSYSGSAPTGREPQSKLWYNDGTWWASMYSSAAKAVDIQRLDWPTQTWIDTGVRIDERSSSLADALWDGTKLYVVSAVSNQSYSCTPPTSGDLTMRVLRYSYNASTKTYSLDAGFPVTIATAAVQAVSLAEDTTGMIWVTWGYPSSSHGNVYITHSTTDTAHYATPFVLPLSGVTDMECSDYSAIVSYSGNIGVMWSNQTESDMYFGTHVDGQPDTAWTRSIALSGTGWADNHVNVKSLVADPAGQVFAASKTSLNGDQCPPSTQNDSQPLIVLTWMDGTGGWQHRTVSTAHYCWTRPIVQIDAEDRQVYVFGTQPAPGSSYGSGGSIMYKQTSLDNPNFDSGAGLPFIQLGSNPSINNATGTKQTVNQASGLVVLAADDSTHHYVHNAIAIGGPDTTPPTIVATAPADGAANVTTSATATVTFSEDMASGTINGSTFTLTDTTAGSGVPATVSYNSSTRTATLTPTSLLPSSHAFTARVLGGASGVTDLAGNPMTSDVTWGFTTAGASGPIFSDGFESGSFSAWSLVKIGGDGTATVQSGVVKTGSYAARLTESTRSGSYAYIRKTLASSQNELTVSMDVQIVSQGTSGKIPLLRLYDSGGVQRFSLDRLGSSGALSFTDGAGTITLANSLALSTWGHLDVHVVAGTGNALVDLSLNGSSIYYNQARTIAAAPRTLQIGNDTKRQLMTAYADNVVVSAPGAAPAAPDTTITGGPSGTVNTASPTFTFTSSVPGSTFGCSLDGGISTPCTSPASYGSLADGAHTFSVAATANGLTDPSPATRTWTIDTVAPSVSSTAPTDGAGDVSRSTTVQATFSEAMASGSIGTSSFTLFDDTAATAVAATVAYNGATNTATLTPSAQLAASHHFTATVKGGSGGVTDLAGNPLASDVSWGFTTTAAVDTTPPTTTLTAPASGATVSGTSVSLNATATDDVAVDHVDFLVNGALVGSDSTSPYSVTWDSTTVPDGSVTITARAFDTSQNQADDSHTVTVSNSTGGSLFSDGFESGSFFLWSAPVIGGDGSASVQNQVVKTGTYAAKLTESATSGSKAYVRTTLAADQTQLTVTEDVQVFAEGTSSQNVPLLRLFDSGGTRIVSLFRQSASGNKVYIGYGGSNRLTTGLLPLGTWATFSVRIISGTGNATVEVRMNGTLIYSDTAATLPALRTLQIGNETAAQPMGIYVDNFVATSP